MASSFGWRRGLGLVLISVLLHRLASAQPPACKANQEVAAPVNCEVRGVLASITTTFPLTLFTPFVDVFLTLRVRPEDVGSVSISVTAPDMDGLPHHQQNESVLSYIGPHSAELTIIVNQTITTRYGGIYVITMTTSQLPMPYTLAVRGVPYQIKVAQADAVALGSLLTACCPAAGSQPGTGCSTLATALAADHTDPASLCRTPPNFCDANGRVTRLVLQNAGMNCPSGLPGWLSNLEGLEVLDLSHNKINGGLDTIAAALASSSASLSELYLTNTSLRGTIGCQLLNGTALQHLDVTGNALTGPLPACALAPGKLLHLFAGTNNISAPLPEALADSGVTMLDLQFNQIAGTIPNSLVSSKALVLLDLSNNLLRGPLPGPLGVNLEHLYLSNNKLSGGLPESLASKALVDLFLDHNQLSGGLEEFAAALPADNQLLNLHLSSNKLEGPVPDQLQKLQAFNVTEPLLQGVTVDPSAVRLVGLPSRSITLNGNQLKSDYPLWLLASVSRLYSQYHSSVGGAPSAVPVSDPSTDNRPHDQGQTGSHSRRLLAAAVEVLSADLLVFNLSANPYLACPHTKTELTSDQVATLDDYFHLTCSALMANVLQEVPISQALAAVANGQPLADPWTPPSGPGTGAIVGICIAAVAIASALVAAGVYQYKRSGRRRDSTLHLGKPPVAKNISMTHNFDLGHGQI